MRLFSAVRFGAVGMFFSGILVMLQGCDYEESAIALLFLIAVLLGFGGGDDPNAEANQSQTSTPITVIDNFLNFQHIDTLACNDSVPGAQSNGSNNTVFSGAVGLGRNVAVGRNSNVNTGNVGATVVGGRFYSFSEGACTATLLLQWDFSNVNVSGFSEFVIPVLDTSGAVFNNCKFELENNANTEIALNNVTLSEGEVVVDVSSAPRNQLNFIQIGNCQISGVGTIIMGPPGFR